MKPEIHPQYYDTQVNCACGNTWKTGSTMPEINVEICSNCHPFYTGREKMIDTRGRIDKFKKRMNRSQELTKPAKKPRIKKNSKS